MSDLKDAILSRLEKVKGPDHKGEYIALCPFHDDHNTPNLSVNFDKGCYLCFACDSSGNLSRLAARLGIETQAPARPAAASGKRIVDIYHYVDANGKPFEAVRYEPKDFTQRRPNGKGGYIYNLRGIIPMLYHEDEVKAAIERGDPVYFTEGEKDADRLRRDLGLTATTNPMGAGKWDKRYTESLRGADLVIVPDTDGPGREHGNLVAKNVHPVAKGVRVLPLPGDCKDVSDWLDQGGDAEQFRALVDACADYSPPATAPETELEPLGMLLDDVQGFIARFVVTGLAQLTALLLWVLHTWAFEAAECTPYLQVTSPEKQSGKTRLLEVFALLVARAWFTARVSAAVLVRRVAQDPPPTLLLDETDSAFKREKEYAEALRSILNAGYRRGGVASVCVGKDFEPVDFAVFCPKALVGIGELPDTLADRSVRIALKRRAPSERVERFRHRDAEAQAKPLRERLERWAAAATPKLADMTPPLPEALSDRACDVWEPLLAIADLAGDKWPGRAREAALVLSGETTDNEQSLGVRLLHDLRELMAEKTEPVPSTEVVNALVAIEESPWGDLRGKPLDARRLARMLKPYGIKPAPHRVGTSVFKGYRPEDFADAFARYCDPTPELSVTTVTTVAETQSELNLAPKAVTDVTHVTVPEGAGAGDTQPLPDRCPQCGGKDFYYLPSGDPACARCTPEDGESSE